MKQAQVLDDKDIKRVLAAIAKRSYSKRGRAMFMLCYLAGMRVGEIAALKVGDVYEADGAGRIADICEDAEQGWRTTTVCQQVGQGNVSELLRPSVW